MLNGPYYHKSVRRVVAAFGALFNDIEIEREDNTGAVVQTIKVPISYAPKQRFYQSLAFSGYDDKTRVNIVLPRMAYEMTSLFYDSQRKVNTLNRTSDYIETSEGRTYTYAPVPYNMTFSLYLAAKNTDDALRVVEQIVPYFQPHFTVSIFELDSPGISRDVPITLQSVDFSDSFDGDATTDRTIMWTLNFQANAYIYGPTRNQIAIKRTLVDAIVNQGSGITVDTQVAPTTASRFDPHEIVTTITEN